MDKRKVGRPRGPVRKPALIYLDVDLHEWTATKKRTDMINRLLRTQKESENIKSPNKNK